MTFQPPKAEKLNKIGEFLFGTAPALKTPQQRRSTKIAEA
jgi:hypothetical protein